MTVKTKRIILIIIYLLIILSCAWVVTAAIINGAGEGQVGKDMSGWRFLRAFTPDSNILCALFSAASLIFVIKDKNAKLPDALKTLNLTGTAAVTLTFLVVLLFLAPLSAIRGGSYFTLFAGNMFHLHFFNPALAVAALIISSKGYRFSKKEIAVAILPTAVYSIVYALNVLVFKTFSDFYSFTMGGKLWVGAISLTVLYAVTLLIAFALAKICEGRKNKGETEI